MALSRAAIRRESVSLLKFPFLSQVQVFWCEMLFIRRLKRPVDKFPYLGSSVSSTEKDINRRLTKAWTAIDKLSIIWKSDLTDEMKRSFFQAAVA